jgi:uncharacterized ferritin-like protein (DUF455 family)
MPSLRAYCQRILEAPDLASKLAAPAEPLCDESPGPALHVDAPARAAGLALAEGADALPRPGALGDPASRAACLARFAHHELMAVELFAWAILRWPGLSPALRCGWLGILLDEQRHCALYLERLRAHGSRLEEQQLSGYFWRHSRAIADAPDGPRAFLAAMGLTLEQANLDFTLLYRDGFRQAGDEASARVCQAVHDDEIGHVRFARTWLLRLTPDARDDAEAYERAVPFPLSAARAKGRHFDVAGRRRAGLSPALVEHVRTARSSQETRRRGVRPPRS